jgi:hypothetical protein
VSHGLVKHFSSRMRRALIDSTTPSGEPNVLCHNSRDISYLYNLLSFFIKQGLVRDRLGWGSHSPECVEVLRNRIFASVNGLADAWLQIKLRTWRNQVCAEDKCAWKTGGRQAKSPPPPKPSNLLESLVTPRGLEPRTW